jgi:hypothetical protein
MSKRDTLRLALIAVFAAVDDKDNVTAADALTDLLCAFADVVRGEPVDLVADNTQALLITEIRALREAIEQPSWQLLNGRAANYSTSDIDTSGLPG